jgi:hypothetical protein
MGKFSDLKKRIDRANTQGSNESLVVPLKLTNNFSDDEIAKYRRLFSFYDIDGSGSIDRDELSQVLEKIGQKSTPDRLDALKIEGESEAYNVPVEVVHHQHQCPNHIASSTRFFPCFFHD